MTAAVLGSLGVGSSSSSSSTMKLDGASANQQEEPDPDTIKMFVGQVAAFHVANSFFKW